MKGKICLKCQAKNQESSNFCKKCGTKFSNDSTFQEKREHVMGENKKKSYLIPISFAIAAVMLVGVGYWIIEGNTGTSPNVSSPTKVTGQVDYAGLTVRMTDVTAKVENGKISIPLSEVMEKKLIRFEYEGNGLKIPLLSYITLAGRVVTAISMCEPCKSTRFHIKDKSMVCNACYTEWNLDTLKGIKGGCLNYPPEVIPSTVVKDRILIDEKVVVDWKPRV